MKVLTERIQVLEKVKGLLLAPENYTATTEEVAAFYGVSTEALQESAKQYMDELVSDGYQGETGIFTKRSILRMSMFICSSKVANEVMMQLLNIQENN